MEERTNLVAVAFCSPSDDWFSQVVGWWCGSQSKRDKTFGCSHCSLIIDDQVYEWRVGGLEILPFKEWIRELGGYRIKHWVSLHPTNRDKWVMLDRLQSYRYSPGPSYLDFLKHALGKKSAILCTGFIRVVLGLEVYNDTPYQLHLCLRENDAHPVLPMDTTQVGITWQDTPTVPVSASLVDTTNHPQTESNT